MKFDAFWEIEFGGIYIKIYWSRNIVSQIILFILVYYSFI